jgi:hypothetical protein
MSFHDFAHAVESFGRDPASIIRSVHLPVSYHQPGSTQGAITEAIDAGFRHIVLGLASPYPAEVAHWVAETFIGPTPCPK